MSLRHLVPLISQVGGTKMQREGARRRQEDVQTESEKGFYAVICVLFSSVAYPEILLSICQRLIKVFLFSKIACYCASCWP